jgi:hypothetical protein
MLRLPFAVFLAAAALPLLARTPPAAPPADDKLPPMPSETTSVTDHELQLDGKTIHCKATAGTLLIDGDDEKPYVDRFLCGVRGEPRQRPAHQTGHVPL